ncbi:MAG: hypothetical protein ACXWFT_13415, partial [Actinomycetota bacterium]
MSKLRAPLNSVRDQLLPRSDEVTFAGLDALRRRRSARRRVTAGIVAGLIALGGVAVMVRAFDPNPSAPPATPPPTPSPQIVGSIQVGPTGQTTALTAGFGSLWVTAYGIDGGEGIDRAALLRVDPTSMSIMDTIPVPTVPTWETGGGGLLATADAIWIAGSGGHPQSAQLVRVDPTNGATTTYSSDDLNGFTDVATDGESLFALGQDNEGVAVQRVDPSTGRSGAPVRLSGDMGRQIVATPGAVIVEELSWQGDGGPCASLASIDPSTMELLAEAPPPAEACSPTPVDIGRLFASRGRVWTTQTDRFVPVDQASALPLGEEGLVVDASGIRSTVATDGGGAWFVSGKSLARADLEAGTSQRFPTRIGWSTAALLDGSLWALDWDGTLTRVDLFSGDASSTPSPTTLEIGLTSDVDAWHVAASQAGVFVTGANELVSVDPDSGAGRTVATGPWDYDYTDIDVSGNQVAVVSGRDMETFLGDGSRLSQAEIKPGVGNLLHVALDGRWLWVSTTNGLLARVDPDNGRIDYAMPANTGPLVVGDGYVFVGNLRVNSQSFAFRLLPFWATGATDSAVVGQHLWLVGNGWVRCADIRSLEPCGDLSVPDAVAIAGSGTHLFVLTATGSSDPDIYIPDPDHPATVVAIDAEAGRRVGSPVPLPDVTPATISAWNQHAWIGFHDEGKVIRIDLATEA